MIILIAGVSRSGKSILAKKLCVNQGMSYFPLDGVISTLESLYPDIGIKHFDDNLTFSPILADFVKELLSHLEYEDLDVVLDTYQLFPNDYLQVFPDKSVPIVYLGYPNLSPVEKLGAIRAYQRTRDWTNRTDDHDMISILSQYIKESKIMASQCQEFGLPFFDTGTDFQSAIDEGFSYLCN